MSGKNMKIIINLQKEDIIRDKTHDHWKEEEDEEEEEEKEFIYNNNSGKRLINSRSKNVRPLTTILKKIRK
jgi:hypothetical protein